MCDLDPAVVHGMRRDLREAELRIKKLETIIGKMIIDTPFDRRPTDALTENEKYLAESIGQRYFAEGSTGV